MPDNTSDCNTKECLFKCCAAFTLTGTIVGGALALQLVPSGGVYSVFVGACSGAAATVPPYVAAYYYDSCTSHNTNDIENPPDNQPTADQPLLPGEAPNQASCWGAVWRSVTDFFAPTPASKGKDVLYSDYPPGNNDLNLGL